MTPDEFGKICEPLGQAALKVANDGEANGAPLIFVILCTDLSDPNQKGGSAGGTHMFTNIADENGKPGGKVALDYLRDFVVHYKFVNP